MNVVGQTSNVSRSAVIPARQNPLDLRRHPASPPPQQPKLLDRLREALRSRHYSRRTEQCFWQWACPPRREASRRRQVKRLIFFHKVRHPAEMGEPEVNAFLTHLATKGNVSASTRNQALSALLFLDRTTMLPEAVKWPLADHLERVKRLHQRDVADDYGRVELPDALARKYPKAEGACEAQSIPWGFPRSGGLRRKPHNTPMKSRKLDNPWNSLALLRN